MTAAATTGGPSADDRYTASRPCPVCSGHQGMPRGHGIRCEGYLFGDGAYCARDSEGKRHPSLELYWHRLHDTRQPRETLNGSSRIVEIYDYTDERGELLYQVVRKEPKNFPQRRPNGSGGFVWNLNGITPTIYHLPEVIAAVAADDPIYICEGEKDVNAVRALNFPATCNSGGAKKWSESMSGHLRGATDVRVVADRDPDGYLHAAQVAASLRKAGVGVTVFAPIVGKDVSDHLAAGRTLEELVEIDPEKLTAGAPKLEEQASPSRFAVERVGFSGARLRALLERPAPDPIFSAIPPRGHFTGLIAPSFSGKTSLELWLGMAYASGTAPWQGAPVLGPGRVLIYSLDEAPEQVARRMNGLALFHPAGPLAGYADNLVVIGPDRETDPALLETLRFDQLGLDTLGRWLDTAAQENRPFVAVFIDAYADVIPLGESENSNEEGTRIGGALERLAVRYGPAIVLLHHAGKPKQDAGSDLPDLRYLGRGGSALTAKARTIFSLEVVAGMPHLRRVRAATNLGRSPAPTMFQVCDPTTAAEEILFFRPVDAFAHVKIDDLLKAGETITTNMLARRLAGESLAEDREPPGEMKKLAAGLRERWREAGLVTVTPGKNNSKMIERTTPGGTDEAL